jgi:hypothetical protein
MSRALLISDCDEVLLHWLRHFGAWAEAEHSIDYRPEAERFSEILCHRETGEAVPLSDALPLVERFFESEMHRQTLAPGALEALGRIGEVADILILTNIGDRFHPHRVAQLDAHGIRHEVMCNRGPKGPAVARIVADRAAGRTAFVDDMASHHSSVGRTTPDVWRLHMVADPEIARLIPAAPDAHKRIDRWAEATDWILDRFAGK